MGHPRLQRFPFAHPYYRSPVSESCLVPSVDLDTLPMFQPLSHEAKFPSNTVYPFTPYFQAQGNIVPRYNRTVCGQEQTTTKYE